MKFISNLESLGLSQKQIRAYLMVLPYEYTIPEVFAEQNIFTLEEALHTLEVLGSRGLVYRTSYNGNEYYHVRDPDFFIIDGNASYTLDMLLSRLFIRSLQVSQKRSWHDQLYNEAKKSITPLLHYTQSNEVKIFTSYGHNSEPSQETIRSVEQTMDEYARHGVKIKAIVPDVAEIKNVFLPYIHFYQWDVRVLPKSECDRTSYTLIGDYLRVLSRDQGINLVLHTPDFTAAARSLFELSWHQATPLEIQEKIWTIS